MLLALIDYTSYPRTVATEQLIGCVLVSLLSVFLVAKLRWRSRRRKRAYVIAFALAATLATVHTVVSVYGRARHAVNQLPCINGSFLGYSSSIPSFGLYGTIQVLAVLATLVGIWYLLSRVTPASSGSG